MQKIKKPISLTQICFYYWMLICFINYLSLFHYIFGETLLTANYIKTRLPPVFSMILTIHVHNKIVKFSHFIPSGDLLSGTALPTAENIIEFI